MPLDDELTAYLEWLSREHPGEVDFVVLYGSRARGTHRPHSDYDLLVGLSAESSLTFNERFYEFNPSVALMVEAKPFTPSELGKMWFKYKRMMLDPLYEGIVLLDNGAWKHYQEAFKSVMERGILEREGTAWIWHKEREPADSPLLAEDRRLQALPW